MIAVDEALGAAFLRHCRKPACRPCGPGARRSVPVPAPHCEYCNGSDNHRAVEEMAPVLGLDPALGEGARASGLFSVLWYVVFMVPFFLWSPDAGRRPSGTAGAVAEGLRGLKATLAGLPSRPSLLAYLLSSIFYRDAILGIGTFGGIYATGVLGWGMFELGIFGLVILIAGALGAWAGGLQDRRRGPKPVIVFNIVLLTAAAAAIMTIAPNEVLFIAVGTAEAPSALPAAAFYFCGAVIGATSSAAQSSAPRRARCRRRRAPCSSTRQTGSGWRKRSACLR